MSSDKAKAFHSITIGERNTWDNWHLVPTSRPIVNPPGVKTNYITVPGRNGELDLTEALAGRAVYSDRTGEWEFYVINSGQVDYNSSYAAWYSRYTTIMQYVQGKEFQIILDDDPDYYYTGRISVSSWDSEAGNSRITLNYVLSPYKLDLVGYAPNWLWDPFFFGDPSDPSDKGDLIKSYKNLPVSGTKQITYILSQSVASHPVITCSASKMHVIFDGTTYSLKRGRNEMNAISLHEGNNVFTFTGNGRVTIEAIGGLL